MTSPAWHGIKLLSVFSFFIFSLPFFFPPTFSEHLSTDMPVFMVQLPPLFQPLRLLMLLLLPPLSTFIPHPSICSLRTFSLHWPFLGKSFTFHLHFQFLPNGRIVLTLPLQWFSSFASFIRKLTSDSNSDGCFCQQWKFTNVFLFFYFKCFSLFHIVEERSAVSDMHPPLHRLHPLQCQIICSTLTKLSETFCVSSSWLVCISKNISMIIKPPKCTWLNVPAERVDHRHSKSAPTPCGPLFHAE